MKRAVVDASVLIKLFFEENHSEAAERHVQAAEELLAPDLIWSEVANVIWKRHRRGDLSEEDAAEIAARIIDMPLHIHPTIDLIPDALHLAMQFDRTVYDSLYVALAVRTESVMVTGDERLVNAMADSPLKEYMAWIGDENL